MTDEKLRKIAIVLIAVLTAVLVFLAILVHYHSVLNTDIFLSKDLQAAGDSTEERTIIYRIFYAISLFGKPVVAGITVAAAALLFWREKYYRETIYVLVSPISVVINSLVKILVGRPRPSASLVQILATETDKSFPSGHVVFYTAFFGLLFIILFFTDKIPGQFRRVIQFLCIFLIVAISFSRVYLGVHWVTDTIGGYSLGIIILLILAYFYLKPKLKHRR